MRCSGRAAGVFLCGWDCQICAAGRRAKSFSGIVFAHFIPYSAPMEVHFTTEQQAKIAEIAKKSGTAPERLVTDVVARYLDEESRFLAAVEKGIAAAKRGEFVEEEQMDARLEAMFKR
jgi:predicted transcriptional regulator